LLSFVGFCWVSFLAVDKFGQLEIKSHVENSLMSPLLTGKSHMNLRIPAPPYRQASTPLRAFCKQLVLRSIVPCLFGLPLVAQAVDAADQTIKRTIPGDSTLLLVLQGADSDGDTLTWTVKQPSMHGVVVIEDTKESVPVKYQPNQYWNGSDSFIIEASDGMGGTQELRVNVTVSPVNHAPVNSKKPVITGETKTGQVLTANVGEWDDRHDGAASEFTYAFQWLRSNTKAADSFVPIAGATSAQYQVQDSDQTAYLAVRVTATEKGDPSVALNQTALSLVRRIGNHAPMISVISPDTSPEAVQLAKAAEAASAATAMAKAAEEKKAREETMVVTEFVFEGNVTIGKEALTAAVSDYVGKPIGLSQINEAAVKITRLYRDKGMSIAEAFIPQQQVEDGKVRIAVLEGVVGEVKVSGNTNYNSEFIREHVVEALGSAVLTNIGLEKGLLTLNRNPGLVTTSLIAPGAKPGTVDILVNAQDEGPAKGRLEYNNYGSDTVSANRYIASAEAINLADTGANLKAQALFGDRPSELSHYSLGLTAPLNRIGTRIGLSVSSGSYDVTKVFADLGIRGESSSGSIYVNHPFILERSMALTGELGIRGSDADFFVLNQTTAQDKTRSIYAMVSSEFDTLSGKSALSAELSLGLGGALGGMEDATNSSRTGADNQFTKLRLNAAYSRPVYQTWSMFAGGSAQWANNSLVSGEEWQVGGAGSVRGFAPGVISGSGGYQGTLEMRYTQMGDIPWTAYGFIDHGVVTRKNPLIAQSDMSTVTGVGFGLTAKTKLPMFSNTPKNNLDFTLDVGWPVAGDDKLRDNSAVINVKTTVEF
jgi:hemolysin activation/secretion protein